MDKTGRLIYVRREESVKSISKEKTEEDDDADESYYGSSYYGSENDRGENPNDIP